MNNTNQITCKVKNDINLLVKTKMESCYFEKPIYAINWFSTKYRWLYDLYNLMAYISLKKVGGTPIFKGRLIRTILNDAEDSRDSVLIIRYPRVKSFKSMIENSYFNCISTLRLISTENYSFCFTHKIQLDCSPIIKKRLFYAIHHFKCNKESSAIIHQIQSLINDKVSIKYAGIMVANLYIQKKGELEQKFPNVVDNIIIFQASSEHKMTDIFESKKYKEVIKKIPYSYIGLLKRTF